MMRSNGSKFDVVSQLAALRRYARVLVRNRDDADDLVNDALVRAYERAESFHDGRHMRAWLFTILHNLHIDQLRVRRREAAFTALVDQEREPSTGPQQEEMMRLADVRRAFALLPDDQRHVLHLVAVEGMDYADAAATLGIPVGTLMSRLSRARARLRAMEEDATFDIKGNDGARLRLVPGGQDSDG